ncbi:hypothetical protein D3C80_249270 [compost metagenome]
MRYPASEKLEIIRTVEGSHLPTKQTLDMLGIARTTFYRWYDLYLDGGVDALEDLSPRPKAIWNRIPRDRRDNLIEFALEHEALTTRELAVKYTDEKRYFVLKAGYDSCVVVSSRHRLLLAFNLKSSRNSTHPRRLNFPNHLLWIIMVDSTRARTLVRTTRALSV